MKLSNLSTTAPKNFSKERYKNKTEEMSAEIAKLQNILYAQSKYKVLIILQGMDASGKDGTIKGVFKGINPLGCRVHAFKAPTEEERAHDFLWRIHQHTPKSGMIQIFNRSYYEDVLVPTVYKTFDARTIEKRYEHINNFEKLLSDSNTIILKFFLHISKGEQANRLMERKTNPEKFWKHNDHDAVDRKSWNKYMEVYEQIFKKCNDAFPWHVIPADQNWFRDYTVAKIILKELKKLDLRFPTMSEMNGKNVK
jgi:PPK2 family polyphosphate:nucleotide phosphotransferase